jgi:hypothetical protein
MCYCRMLNIHACYYHGSIRCGGSIAGGGMATGIGKGYKSGGGGGGGGGAGGGGSICAMTE